VDRTGSWLYCIGKDILSKESCWVFLPCKEGFPKINLCVFLCLFICCLFISVYGYLNVKRRSKCYGKSNVNKTNENSTTYKMTLVYFLLLWISLISFE
jgi:hypothetical protein